MKTRYSSLVTLKKSTVQSSEQALQSANANLNNATDALELSYSKLDEVSPPRNGTMSQMLASRTLFDSQRGIIQHNKEWVSYTQNQVDKAKEQLKSDMIDYEKFNYLELEEIKKILQEKKLQEAKDLDEVALMTHTKKQKAK